jgi:cell division protein FtsI (penicillin-binding protein 3)
MTFSAPKTRKGRVGVLSLILGGLFAAIAARLVMLTVVEGVRLRSLARTEHTESVELNASRGPIVDRHGTALALSAESRSVYARPGALLRATSGAQRSDLARLLGLKPDKLEARLATRAHFVWLARQIEPDVARAVEALNLPGVGAVREFKRFYPERSLAAAVVGMTGLDGQGLSGVELRYDNLIRGGTLKLEFERDARGHVLLDNLAEFKDAEQGARVVLTIDAALQTLVERELATSVHLFEAHRGTAVVLDPFTGEVLAMATVENPEHPGFERLHTAAIESSYEPGSTIKGLLAAIALENGIVNTHTKFFCENGQMKIGRFTIHDHGAHGWLDLGEIIAVSSNIGAAKIALAMGAERYFQGLRAFGLGSPTGIDLPGEAGGLLRPPATWKPIELANQGFGQGLAVTPLQLALAYSAIANGGQLMRPYVVKAAYDSSGRVIFIRTPQVVRRVISPPVAHQMSVLLAGVVQSANGTGRRAGLEDVSVAGKTGTAQMVNPLTRAYYRDRMVGSFVGFLPAEDPRVVILVALEGVGHGKLGGLVAAPAFRTIAASAMERLRIAPKSLPHGTPGYESAELLPLDLLTGARTSAPSALLSNRSVVQAKSEHSAVPDFTGLSLREALALGRRLGLDIEANGSGYVVAQNPSPKTPLGTLRRVKIELDPSVYRLAGDARRVSPRALGRASHSNLTHAVQ